MRGHCSSRTPQSQGRGRMGELVLFLHLTQSSVSGCPAAHCWTGHCPRGPRGLTVQNLTPSTPAGSPETTLTLALLLPLEPFLHLLALSLGKGRVNPFGGNLLYLQGSCPNETGEATPTHNLAASHLSGSEQGQPWPRTFSTRLSRPPSQASINAGQSWDANQGGLIWACRS